MPSKHFAGSEGGGKAAAIALTLIETAKLNKVDPQVWLTDVLGRIAEHPVRSVGELVPWAAQGWSIGHSLNESRGLHGASI